MEDLKFMDEALALARRSAAEGEVPVGCVIVCRGEVVGRGRNCRETAKNALGHAEIQAIDEACRTLGGWRLWDCTLYVTLEPCAMCAGAILNARIKRDFPVGRSMALIAIFGIRSASAALWLMMMVSILIH